MILEKQVHLSYLAGKFPKCKHYKVYAYNWKMYILIHTDFCCFNVFFIDTFPHCSYNNPESNALAMIP